MEICKEGLIDTGKKGKYIWNIELADLHREANKILKTPDYIWLDHAPTETLGNYIMDLYRGLKNCQGDINRYPLYKSGKKRKNRICFISKDDIKIDSKQSTETKIAISMDNMPGILELDKELEAYIRYAAKITIEKYLDKWALSVWSIINK